jgi:hypothetical protein
MLLPPSATEAIIMIVAYIHQHHVQVRDFHHPDLSGIASMGGPAQSRYTLCAAILYGEQHYWTHLPVGTNNRPGLVCMTKRRVGFARLWKTSEGFAVPVAYGCFDSAQRTFAHYAKSACAKC